MNKAEIDNLFTEKYEELSKKMFLIAYAFLKDFHLSNDAVNESFYKAYSKFHMLKNIEYFSTWIIRILINECKNNIKKIKI